MMKKIPTAIKNFEDAFNSLEIRQQKAQLQSILKAANIYKDGKIELEFRGKELTIYGEYNGHNFVGNQ
jgi:hypothetical protein